MPFPAFIKFHLNGTVLSGRTMKIGGLSDVREVWEFNHEVGSGHYEDYGYRKEWAYSHCPLTVITEIGNHVPPLYNSICKDENLEKVEIFWPQYKSKEHKEDIYFTHKLWPVKIRSVELFFPNVKDRQFEKYGHLAKIVFRYHWIEWKYVQGNRIFKGEWPSFSTEGMQDDKNRKELEEVENAPMSAQESTFLDYWENKDKKKSTPEKRNYNFGKVTGKDDKTIANISFSIMDSTGKELYKGKTTAQGEIIAELETSCKPSEIHIGNS
jgi:type VI secretion system Hcp family effector